MSMRIILNALRTGKVTESAASLEAPAPAATKGRPALRPELCDGDAACVAACPSAAISFGVPRLDNTREMRIDYGACVFCGRCAEVCAAGALTISTDFALAARRRTDLVLRVSVACGELEFPFGKLDSLL